MSVHLVIPHVGVGPVRFGMTRDEVRAAVSERPEPFWKGVGEWRGEHQTDAFVVTGFHVYYAGPEVRVEFVEAFAAPGVTFDLLGVDPLGQPATAIVGALRERARLVEDEPGCYLLPDLDVALWREAEDEPNFASLSVGVWGYFAPPAS